MKEIAIRTATPDDSEWIRQMVVEHSGGIPVITPSGMYVPCDLPGFIAVERGERVGLLNYRISGGECEIVLLASVRSGHGIGTALLRAVIRLAEQNGCTRLWLITTNDNLNALRFYQKRRFRLKTVHQNAMEQVRRVKPTVPLLGKDDIPLRDTIELEVLLGGNRQD